MRTRFVYLSLLLSALAACTKSVDPTGIATFQLNGKPISSTAGYCEYDYYAGKFSATDLVLLTGSSNQGYLDMHVGADTGNSFFSIYQTDSLTTGVNYKPELSHFTPDSSINIFQSGNFIIHFTSTANNLVSGTFSGMITGTDTTTAALITDTISNGVFTNIPIQRIYH